MKKFSILVLLAVAAFAMFTFSFAIADPNGANFTEVGDSRLVAGAPQANAALAGNVTELTISGDSVTQSWQGYYGNVSGGITLSNAAGNVLYNWSAASPQGEIFASNDSSVTWSNIACFNATNLTRVAALESTFNIGITDVDGVNETFSNSTAHDAFDVGSTSFAADACFATFVYDVTGAGVDGNFEEVLLTDTSYDTHVVFATILDDNQAGFDGNQYDFEMIVLEDGHSGDSSTTTYYFYVELE